jgi:hypothetical protein
MTPVAKYSLAAILAVLGPGIARSDEEPPARPSILFNRWQENWSVLADPSVAHEPLDDLKYIPLGTAGYLSLGADLRERFESNDAANFAVGSKTQDYVISRLEAHADLRLGDAVQAFVQLESAFAPGKIVLSPVDQDRLDLEQAFIVVSEPLGEGLVRLRIGRQQFAFDLQRFVSARDGPNVRQSYDAIWGDYEWSALRLSGFYSQPVQSRDTRAFDNFSSRHLTYGGMRAEYEFSEHISVSAYVSEFRQDNARFPSISGNERRSILDVRFAGGASGFDWDAEAMGQGGVIAEESVRAWAIGTRAGYTIDGLNWTPRVGLQFDAASGDSDSHDSRMGTFNPLFPNGSYLTLAGYTGYTNFIHLKPSLTLSPVDTLTVMLAVAAQWRQTTADAVYTQPDIPVAGTAGRGGAYTGSYAQTRIDWQANPHFAMALEAVRFDIGSAIRQAGGRDATYLGLEGKLGW